MHKLNNWCSVNSDKSLPQKTKIVKLDTFIQLASVLFHVVLCDYVLFKGGSNQEWIISEEIQHFCDEDFNIKLYLAFTNILLLRPFYLSFISKPFKQT